MRELTNTELGAVAGGMVTGRTVICQNHIGYVEDPEFFDCPTGGELNPPPTPPRYIPGP